MNKKFYSLILFATIIGISTKISFIQTQSYNINDDFEGFYDFLTKYNVAIEEEKESLISNYILWQESDSGFPAMENDTYVVFIYYDPESIIENCSISGDFTMWDSVNMTKLDINVSFFYLGHSFEPKSRIDYLFIIDENVIQDPRNSNQSPADLNEYYSELRMPEFIQPQEIYYQDNISHGSVSALTDPWTNPQVNVYLPPNYNSRGSYSTVYLADGSCYLNILSTVNVLDNLIAAKRIEPIIAIFTDPKNFPDPLERYLWYKCNPEYLTFLDSLVEHIDTTYATNKSAYARLHMGFSAGGLVSAYAVYERSETFKLLASQSGAFWAGEEYGIKLKYMLADSSYQLKTWFSVGTYENNNHHNTPMVDDTQEMVEICENNNWPTKAVYNPECHSFGAWRHLLDDIFEYFFPYKGLPTNRLSISIGIVFLPFIPLLIYTRKYSKK
ncbi:MAG: esterase family protein [Asgard group archaeon]|nr:esterase family protein [Asgard group archaeon]